MNTPTITTLTAEVRVLMVSGHQFTLFMFRQLDIVQWNEFTPMGRVNVDTGDEPDYAIGADATGNLVRATPWDAHVPGLRESGSTVIESSRDRNARWRVAYDALPLIVLADA